MAYPINEQIDIYLYSQYGVEGGSDEIFRFIASDGEKKIPAILKRIDSDNGADPRTRFGLINVLDFIDQNCQCLANNEDAMMILSRNEMLIVSKDSEGFRGYKELYHQILVRIESRMQTIRQH